MKDLKKKKLLIFDLDGVIFDSKKNMEFAWNKTSKKFNLKIPFYLYFKKIGMPFLKILETLNVKPDNSIYKCFKKSSLKKINLIKPYQYSINELKLLKKNKINFSIVTSKDLKRTKYLLNKYKIKPSSIHCPNSKLRGKPFPDHLLASLKKNKVKANNAYYFGDMDVDFQSAKNAKIKFVFAKYGYGKTNKKYKSTISNFKEINKYINY